MLGKITVCALGAVLAACPLLAADATHPSSTLTVTDMTAIPGKTLPPGTYTIQVVDHLSDRYVVKVGSTSSGEGTLFIGILNSKLPTATHGMVLWKTPAAGATYLRGWKFSGISAPLEFVYPKADAVAIAKANDSQVAAIDPESDNMTSKASLSKDEMQIVTLWLLTPTHVGVNSAPGISAAKYQQVASVTPPRKPVISKLPHTASLLPWFWLVGLVSTLGAFSLGGLRLSSARQ